MAQGTALVPYLPPSISWTRSFNDVRKEFIRENGKDLWKIFLYATRWLDQLQKAVEIPMFAPQGPLAVFKLLKNGFGVLDLEAKIDKVFATCCDPAKGYVDRLQSVTEIMNPLVDGAELVNTIALNSLMTAMPGLKVAHSFATLFGSAIGTHKNLTAKPAKTSKEEHLNWIELGRNVSYLVVGTVGSLIALGFTIKAQEIILLIGVTAGCAFTIYGLFYKRQVNPKYEYELLGVADRKMVFEDYKIRTVGA